MNYILRNADSIPLKLRIEIIDVHYPGMLQGNRNSFDELFKIYNRYIAPPHEQLSQHCPSCYEKIDNHFKMIVRHWQQ